VRQRAVLAGVDRILRRFLERQLRIEQRILSRGARGLIDGEPRESVSLSRLTKVENRLHFLFHESQNATKGTLLNLRTDG
jgi:hypothetical protein